MGVHGPWCGDGWQGSYSFLSCSEGRGHSISQRQRKMKGRMAKMKARPKRRYSISMSSTIGEVGRWPAFWLGVFESAREGEGSGVVRDGVRGGGFRGARSRWLWCGGLCFEGTRAAGVQAGAHGDRG